MRLYRGDALPSAVLGVDIRRGQTFAEHFLRIGLMARFADGGTSNVLAGKDLIDLTLMHVGCNAGHSPLISFSECLDTASSFSFSSARARKGDFISCDFEIATHFIWLLDIELPIPVQPGQYELKFKSSSVNCKKIVQAQNERALNEAVNGNMERIPEVVMNLAAIQYIEDDIKEHRATLIDVMAFLAASDTSKCDRILLKNTYERAARDKEWLIYPTDRMGDGFGISARLPMNRHLSVHHCFRIDEVPAATNT